MTKAKLAFLLYNLVVVFGMLAVLELCFKVLLRNPSYIPGFLQSSYQHYYSYHVRNTIQMDTTCARYDSGLFYTLKPGHFSFKNIEFNTNYSVNSMGLRDNEAALKDPEVIFLGDSFTMGWGVDDDSTIVSDVRRITNKRILNAGESSYGTAREFKLLKRLNTNNLKTLVIQYHNNDGEENLEFIKHQNKLPISSKKVYDSTVRSVRLRSTYYFGKHGANLGMNLIRELTGRYDRYQFNPAELHAFLEVLQHCPKPLDSVRIVFFEACSHNQYVSKFSDALAKEIQNKKYPDYIRNIKIIKLEGILDNSDYYILDDHIRPSGNAKIARILSDQL